VATVKEWQSVFSRVKSALLRRGCSSHDADDLVQDAYLKLAGYEVDHTVLRPDAFLMRAALNLAIDFYRVQRNHGESVLLEEMTLDELLRADALPTTEATVLARERMARLSESLAGMGLRTRRIFLAHHKDGMTYPEIARLHGLSVSSVEKHMAKATMAVMRWMEGW